MDGTTIIAIVICVIFSNLFMVVGLLSFEESTGEPMCEIFNPVTLYKNSKLGIIGVFISEIVLHAIACLWALGYWIYRLFTLGRR